MINVIAVTLLIIIVALFNIYLSALVRLVKYRMDSLKQGHTELRYISIVPDIPLIPLLYIGIYWSAEMLKDNLGVAIIIMYTLLASLLKVGTFLWHKKEITRFE